MYIYDKDVKYVENNLDTYRGTLGKVDYYENNSISIYFYDPIYYKNELCEIFPTMNVTQIPKEEYNMQLYFNLVKGLSRTRKKVEAKKDSFKEEFHYGINIKKVAVKNSEIEMISEATYTALNDSLAYIVAQLLYEYIEDEPFTLSLDIEKEKQLKQVKYYLSRCYHNIWHLVGEYIVCDTKKIRKRFKTLGFKSLSQLENEIKRT